MPDSAPTPDLTAVLARLVDALEAQAGVTPEGLSPTEAARFIGVSVSKFHALDASGLLPAAVELGIGKCPRFLRSELMAWMRAGAPSRAQWVHRREAALRKVG